MVEAGGPPNAPVVDPASRTGGHGTAQLGAVDIGARPRASGWWLQTIAVTDVGLPHERQAFASSSVPTTWPHWRARLSVERFIAVGYSMGGPIAQLTWKRHPERVSGLVLCATAARFANTRQRQTAVVLQPLLSLAAKAAPDSFWKEQAERMLERVPDPERRARIQQGDRRDSSQSALVDAAASLAHFDSRRWLEPGRTCRPRSLRRRSRRSRTDRATAGARRARIPRSTDRVSGGGGPLCVCGTRQTCSFRRSSPRVVAVLPWLSRCGSRA